MEGNHRPLRYRPKVERIVEWYRLADQLVAEAYALLVPRVRASTLDPARTANDLTGCESAVDGTRRVAGA